MSFGYKITSAHDFAYTDISNQLNRVYKTKRVLKVHCNECVVKINVSSRFSSECDNCFYAYDWFRKEVKNL